MARATQPEEESGPVMSWQVRLGAQDFSLYTVMSSIGTPVDITLSELTIELFFPADRTTEASSGARRPARAEPRPRSPRRAVHE